MTELKAVLWDMDGTLVDSERFAVEALQQAMTEAGLPIPGDLYDSVVGKAADDIFRWLVDDHGLSMDSVSWEKRKHHHYFLRAENLKGFLPALSTWEIFAKRGIPMAVVSNSDRAIVDVNLRSVGLARPGLVTVSRNDIRKGKPDPEGYLRAAWLLGVNTHECAVIEDSYSGAKAGLAAGMKTFFAPHSTVAAPNGVYQLNSMLELERLMIRQ